MAILEFLAKSFILWVGMPRRPEFNFLLISEVRVDGLIKDLLI